MKSFINETMDNDRPYVLSIAGLDPSGGAGLLADIKTFENHKTYGLGVCSAITFQNDIDFIGLNWVDQEDILQQIVILSERFPIKWAKIGLIESLAVLKAVATTLKDINPNVKIIWDPILTASAGFTFHNHLELTSIEELAKELFLITPNLQEINIMVPHLNSENGAHYLSRYCNILLKGGHGTGSSAVDILYEKSKTTHFESAMIQGTKHGTGCVLSAAILSGLAKEKSLKEACGDGKNYINTFINSNEGLIGYHNA